MFQPWGTFCWSSCSGYKWMSSGVCIDVLSVQLLPLTWQKGGFLFFLATFLLQYVPISRWKERQVKRRHKWAEGWPFERRCWMWPWPRGTLSIKCHHCQAQHSLHSDGAQTVASRSLNTPYGRLLKKVRDQMCVSATHLLHATSD